MTSDSGALEFRILGEVKALVDGRVLPLGGRRQRSLLALLLVEPGKSMSSDKLAHELWAGEPPRGADVTLRSYASKLRAVLGPAASLQGSSAGYTLQVDPLVVDAVRFERHLEAGERDLERGAIRSAVRSLRNGLSLWHGEPFGGLADGGVLGSAAMRLEELRLRAIEKRIEAELELGESTSILDELEALVAEHPFRERLWRHLMLALYRAGRQADALEAYQRVRLALDEELGLEPGEELEQLQRDILRHEVRPARPPEERHNLPAPVSSFVGRARELAEVSRSIRQNRLVTLTGVGGVGKTRLALEAAREAIGDMPGGVWFIDLASISEPGLVPGVVGAAVGAPDLTGTEGLAQLGSRLGAADTLFVLDNCEHLIDAAAESAAALLQTAPGVRVLATSREALGVPGEVEQPVPSLARPTTLDPAAIRGSEAVQLFLERARAKRPEVADDDDTLATAAQICGELDGIPLALELAAARAKALSLPEIAVRLEDRFRFLTAWQRLTPARHRTLREAIDWSYDLLAPRERQTLDRLSVFAGGFTLEAVAQVCLDDVDEDPLEAVERLVRASLVEVVEAARGTRYRQLETIRQYAAERLAAADPDPIMRRHAEYFCRFAEGANLSAGARKFDDSFSRIRAEMPNIRVALRWGLDHDVVLGLQLACALEQFWITNGPREGAAIFSGLLDKPRVPLALRAVATRCLSGCRYYVGDFEAGEALLEQSLAMHRQLGDRPAIGHALMRMAIHANRVGDVAATRALLDESRELSGSDRFSGDETSALMIEARLALKAGRAEEGMALFRQGRESARREGDRWFEVQALLQMSESLLDRDRPTEAAESGRAGLVIASDIGDRQSIVYALALLAWAAAASHDPGRAARLWGAIDGEVARGGPIGQWEAEESSYEAHVLVGPEEDMARGRTDGRAMALDEAIDYAVRPPRA